MKLSGRKIEGANTETIVIPRGEGEDIILRATAIPDYAPFDKLCPAPRAPAVIRAGGERSFNVEDPRFLASIQEHNQRRSSWLIITSLRLGTPELEWERISFEDPNTWGGYVDELRESGFSEVEIVRIVRGCMIANALDEAKLDEARLRFFRSRRQQDAEL